MIKKNLSKIKKKIKNKIIRWYYLLKFNILILGNNVEIEQKIMVSGKGKIVIKDNVKIGYKIGGFFYNNVSELQSRYKDSKIIIEENVSMNNSCFFLSGNLILIKKDSRIGSNVTMMDYEAHKNNPRRRNEIGEFGEIIIGENVWIGNNAIILKNVYIGKNSIVAAGSVVVKGNYPDNCIIGGNPARVIKKI